MRLVRGKLLTPHRLRLLDNYRRSRRWFLQRNTRMPGDQMRRALYWFDQFETFMTKGWNDDWTEYEHPSSSQDA